MELRATYKVRFARRTARKSPWGAVEHRRNDWASCSPSRGVRSSNHDRSCDRRDGWVGPSFLTCNDYEWALVGMAEPATRAKWRALRSARASALKKYLTGTTLSEMGILQQSVSSLCPHNPARILPRRRICQ